MVNKVAILGFPANDFLFQERGSNEEIAEFCESNPHKRTRRRFDRQPGI